MTTPETVMWLAVSHLLLNASFVIAVAVRAVLRELRQEPRRAAHQGGNAP